MALLTGMRNGELFALKWEDIDLDNDSLTVQRSYCRRSREFKSTKAGHWRTVPISVELKSVISELRKTTDGEFVLPHHRHWKLGAQAKVLKEFCRFISIEPIKFHTLRACFATQLLVQGVESMKVMKICGWRDLKTMARYVRLAGIDERGVTEKLQFLPSEDAVSGNVVSIFKGKTE
jgi:integrase